MPLTDPRLAHDVLPVLLWTSGPDGACDYVNDRWAQFTGRPISEMLGWRWTEYLHPEDRESFQIAYTGAVASRAPLRLEFRMLHQDGEYRWLVGLGHPVEGADGEFLGYSGCSIDVTDRRALEKRVARLDRSGEISQLAGGVAHDFNDLLTGIMGHAGLLLEEGSLAPPAREDLVQIRQAADRAATLSRHLLVGLEPALADTPLADEKPWEELSGDETILLAEDDQHVREVVRRALERAGYVVLPVSDAESAAAAADRHPGHIHLLVTDVVLPRMSGRELAARLAIHRPAIRVLYVSGTSHAAIVRHQMLEPGIEFLEKPFSLDRLLRKVRQVLGTKPREDRAAWAPRSPA